MIAMIKRFHARESHCIAAGLPDEYIKDDVIPFLDFPHRVRAMRKIIPVLVRFLHLNARLKGLRNSSRVCRTGDTRIGGVRTDSANSCDRFRF
jgi:hypothetical protein